MQPIENLATGARGRVAGAATPAPSARLLNAAHEFEAELMKELLKPLTAAGEDDGTGGSAGLGDAGALGEFASEALGEGISRHGGLGIARMITESISHRSHAVADSISTR